MKTIKELIEEQKTINANVDKVFEAGKAAGGGSGDNYYDTFWDSFQNYGNRTQYHQTFLSGWNDDCYNPKYPLKISNSTLPTFDRGCAITDTKVDIVLLDNNAYTVFGDCPSMKTVKNIIFDYELLPPSSSTYIISDVAPIENLKFSGTGTLCGDFRLMSPYLTSESVDNIIDYLGWGMTLYLHTNVVAKLTDEQKIKIMSKGWSVG